MLFSKRIQSALRRKLKSKTGASIVMGLMFFMLCFFVSAVILAAAAVNMSRAASQKEEQRAYLAINAAATLLQDEMAKIKNFTASEVLTTHDCHICDAEYDYEVKGIALKNAAEPASFGTALNEMISQLYLSHVKTNYDVLTDAEKKLAWHNAQSFNVEDWSKEFNITADDMPTVHVRMTADSAYSVYMELTVDSKLAASFAMTVEFVASATTVPNVTTVADACHHEQVTVVDNEYGEWQKVIQDQTFSKKIAKTNTTVQWTKVSITKGTLEDQRLAESSAEGAG